MDFVEVSLVLFENMNNAELGFRYSGKRTEKCDISEEFAEFLRTHKPTFVFGKADRERKVGLWKTLLRNVVSIIHCLAELSLGYKPDSLK